MLLPYTLFFRNALRIFCLFLFFSALSCQEIDNEIEESYQESYSEGDLAIAENIYREIDFTEQGVSQKQLNQLFKEDYQLDFGAYYASLLSSPDMYAILREGNSLETPHSNSKEQSSTYRPIGYPYDAQFHKALGNLSDVAKIHIDRIYNIIDPEKDWKSKSEFINAVVNNAIKEQKSNVKANCCLSVKEKDMLITMLNTFADNISAVYDFAEKSKPTPNGRFRLKRFFRKVRSIMVTTVVAAGAGFLTAGPAGAIIGASAALIGSTLDILFNNRCHYAMQCEKGWEQDCDTGECLTNPNWPPTDKNDGEEPGFGGNKDYSHIKGPTKLSATPATANCKGCAVPKDLLTSEVSVLDVYPFASTNNGEPPFSLKGMVDMSKAPASSPKNSLGWPSKPEYFWKTFVDPHNAISQTNRDRINGKAHPQGKFLSPIVDEQYRRNQPYEADAKIGEKIHHHHVNKGRYAIPRSLSKHTSKAWNKNLHPQVTKSMVFTPGKLSNPRGKTIIGRLSIFGDIYDILKSSFSDDPMALGNHVMRYTDGGIMWPPIKGNFIYGKVYYIPQENIFIEVTGTMTEVNGKLYHNLDADRGSKGLVRQLWFILYENYGYDAYERKYIGVGMIRKGFINDGTGAYARIGSQTKQEEDASTVNLHY